MPSEGFRPHGPGGIRASGVSRSFGNRAVLRGVDLEAPSGSIVGVVGDNGTGKSTLLRILAGVLTADEGRVEIAGGPAGIGASRLVPAGDRMLNWRLTARQNLDFFARLGGVRAEDLSGSVERALDAMDARQLASQRVGECSTGQRRRLMIAAGFVACSPVVLLDEPLADLDRDGREAVEGVCRAWSASGGTVLAAAPEADGLPHAADVVVLPVPAAVGDAE